VKNEKENSLTLKNDIKLVPVLNEFQKRTYEKMGIGEELSRKIRLAVEEAVVNVMEYAYPAGTEGEVQISWMTDYCKLKVVIVDSGVPFNPTTKERTDTTLPVEERPIGGLGILLMSDIMDKVSYERIKGKNYLTLEKKVIERND